MCFPLCIYNNQTCGIHKSHLPFLIFWTMQHTLWVNIWVQGGGAWLTFPSEVSRLISLPFSNNKMKYSDVFSVVFDVTAWDVFSHDSTESFCVCKCVLPCLASKFYAESGSEKTALFPNPFPDTVPLTTVSPSSDCRLRETAVWHASLWSFTNILGSSWAECSDFSILHGCRQQLNCTLFLYWIFLPWN